MSGRGIGRRVRRSMLFRSGIKDKLKDVILHHLPGKLSPLFKFFLSALRIVKVMNAYQSAIDQ